MAKRTSPVFDPLSLMRDWPSQVNGRRRRLRLNFRILKSRLHESNSDIPLQVSSRLNLWDWDRDRRKCSPTYMENLAQRFDRWRWSLLIIDSVSYIWEVTQVVFPGERKRKGGPPHTWKTLEGYFPIDQSLKKQKGDLDIYATRDKSFFPLIGRSKDHSWTSAYMESETFLHFSRLNSQ